MSREAEYTPTRAEIVRQCMLIQSRWSWEERKHRCVNSHCDWTVPEVRPEEKRGMCDEDEDFLTS